MTFLSLRGSVALFFTSGVCGRVALYCRKLASMCAEDTFRCPGRPAKAGWSNLLLLLASIECVERVCTIFTPFRELSFFFVVAGSFKPSATVIFASDFLTALIAIVDSAGTTSLPLRELSSVFVLAGGFEDSATAISTIDPFTSALSFPFLALIRSKARMGSSNLPLTTFSFSCASLLVLSSFVFSTILMGSFEVSATAIFPIDSSTSARSFPLFTVTRDKT
mmetsp:Transcript_24990/g.68928  ORF Transcript_24990/g.68928 Transcript_24990/m.68928 type:complete len:222 (+) Transcript_24990:1121-1786(+)